MNSVCIIHKSRINVVKYLFFRVKPLDTSYIHMVYLVWQTRGSGRRYYEKTFARSLNNMLRGGRWFRIAFRLRERSYS